MMSACNCLCLDSLFSRRVNNQGMRVNWGTHLSDSVVGLGHTFPQVCRLGGPAGPAGGGPTLGDGVAI